MITEELQKLYQSYTGVPAENITELPSSGSNRRYFRLTGIQPLIGVYGASTDENEAFLYMAGHFRKCGLPVPEVRIVSEDKTYYLQEDLGDALLFHAIEKGRVTSVFSEEEKELLRKTIRLLPAIQFAGADGFDFSRCYPQPEFNQRSILWDLNYFKYCFLKATGMEFQEDKLEDDFQKMSDVLLRSSSATFMYRDFQSRNVMIKDGEPWFIDFQGGRKGPFYYDIASFLWQAKAKYPDSLRKELLQEYMEALRKYQPIDESYFYSQLRHFVLFRTLQVLGAYGFRGYFEKKPHFIQSVPYAIENLRELLKEEYPEYPYPEVIGYVNNDDGTLTLKVQAVFPYRGVSKAYIHEVTVRDTKDGGIQYVGNRIIEPINNPEIRWHVPRLTRTEWEELYGDN